MSFNAVYAIRLRLTLSIFKNNNVSPKKEFWITNISNRNVTLTDLALNIKAHSSINLLSNHHYYNIEQLEMSAKSGSIFIKKDKIVVRKNAPQPKNKDFYFIQDRIIPSRQRSLQSIKEEYYEELTMSDEDYTNENVEADIGEPQNK